ncbi:family 43 glycosylhydrolase [uncultured Bacteroides sp.]|uniref:family 43 glycosylhydrolase n=1 Tax=uncultured Bacteroides sp. TaxID=162156 RepID=UPI002AABFCBE|nr:family 43 glycosylhydrolase [uncultured Bacteroides sp.]
MTAKHLLLIFTMLLAGIVKAQNPVIQGQFTADPTARVFNGKIYLYPSHDIPAPADKPKLRKDWFCMEDYHVFSSDNLTKWTDHGVILTQKQVNWVNADTYSMWAPDCAYKDGMYYFYFPAMVKPDSITKRFGMMIGVAVSDRPDGGFVPMTEPIKGVYGIDPCTLIDDDGQAYIYWSGRGMHGARLKPNMLQLDSKPVAIEKLPKGMKEGPFVFKRNGKYYFTFPWVPKEGETENLSYAMGDSPLGPFEYKGLIMDQSPTKCWTNHHSIVEYKGEWYLFYHHNDFSPKFDKNRSVRIDKIHFNEDGTIQKVIPTLRGVGITNATDEIQLDRYSKLSKEGAAIAYVDTTNYFAGWKTILSAKKAYVQYNDVDFGTTGLKSVTAQVLDGKGKLLVKIDGKIVAKITTGKDELITVPVHDIPNGVHNLTVAMGSKGSVELDWLKFE